MDREIGHVIHYFNNIGVAVLYLTEELNTGERVHFLGHTTDFVQEVTSMEMSHKKVTAARSGEEIAMKVDEPVRGNDRVYKAEED